MRINEIILRMFLRLIRLKTSDFDNNKGNVSKVLKIDQNLKAVKTKFIIEVSLTMVLMGLSTARVTLF